MSRAFHKDGSLPVGDAIFVFGSNKAGYHGGGAARVACEKFGAQFGVGRGLTGNSYAIPTCDEAINALSLGEIKRAVDEFLAQAKATREANYFVTRIGCGIAGHRDSDIAPMFADAPHNCSLPDLWAKFI